MEVKMTEYPVDNDWLEVKKRALVTMGLNAKTIPTKEWRRRILEANHSPIRRLRFSFYIKGVPSFVATHLARHIHAQPYIKSQREDRSKDGTPRSELPQDAPVNMIWDMNAEELITIAHKRLCNLASKETRELVAEICKQVIEKCPEFKGLLVPDCVYKGRCTEMFPCNSVKKM